MKINEDIKKLYKNRFNKKEIYLKNRIWKVICNSFFQRYINENSIVLDIGAGYCEFINNIKCKQKMALDLNKDIHKFANQNVKVIINSSTNLSSLLDNSIDVVFISNFLEHLKSKEEIRGTLLEILRVLKLGGGSNYFRAQY